MSEDTLLSAMSRPTGEKDAYLVNELTKEFYSLGTPATRAAIIEKLVTLNLIQRKGDKKTKHLIPTEKGTALITILPEAIKSPLMTAQWEIKLKSIELGGLSDVDFMGEIIDMTKNLVDTCEVVKDSEKLFPSRFKVIGKCPRCNKDVIITPKAYSCEDRDCGFVLWKDSKFFTAKKKTFTEQMAIALLTKGKIKLNGCYSEKAGKTYDATILLDDDGGKFVNFKMEFEKKPKK